LLGNYIASTFVTSNDANGGTSVVYPGTASLQQQSELSQPQHA